MLVSRISQHYFEDPIDAAAQFVPSLKADSDLLVALTHIGLDADRELAQRVSGIDVILGGHTHNVTNDLEIVGRTNILHHGCYGRHVGRVEIELESGRVDVVSEPISLSKA